MPIVCQTLLLILATQESSLHTFILSLNTFPFDFFFFHDFSISLTGGSPIHIFSQAWKLLISLTLISSFDSSCILDFYFFFHLLIPFQPFTFLSHFLFLYIFFFFNSLLACGLPSQSKNKSVKRAMSVDFAGDCTCWELGGWG